MLFESEEPPHHFVFLHEYLRAESSMMRKIAPFCIKLCENEDELANRSCKEPLENRIHS